MKQFIYSLCFFVALYALWAVCAKSGLWSPLLFPSPGEVADYLWQVTTDGSLFSAAYVTLRRLVLGYLIGIAVGLPLGVLCARYLGVKNTLGVLALGLQGLPSVCWVPMATLWFGQSEAAMLFVVVMGTIWAVILSTAQGISLVPPIYGRAARSMGCGSLESLLVVILPASAPFVVSGLKQGWAFAWRSLMSAEIFVPVLTGIGLGQVLHFGRELSAMEQVLGIMLVILFIGLLADKLIFFPVERALHRRWGTGKN